MARRERTTSFTSGLVGAISAATAGPFAWTFPWTFPCTFPCTSGTLAGVLAHPNVSAAVILGLGCEVNQIDHYLGDRRLVVLTLQASGGTRATVDAARNEIAKFMERAAAETLAVYREALQGVGR